MNKTKNFTPQSCKECLMPFGHPECETCIYGNCKKRVDEELVKYKWEHSQHYETFIKWYKEYFMIEE